MTRVFRNSEAVNKLDTIGLLHFKERHHQQKKKNKTHVKHTNNLLF